MEQTKKIYLDKNKKHLITRENLEKYKNELFALAEELQKAGKIEEAQATYSTVAKYSKFSLLAGNAESALTLGYLYYNGFGVEKDSKQSELYIVLGGALGNHTCKQLAWKSKDETNGMFKNYLQENHDYNESGISNAVLAYYDKLSYIMPSHLSEEKNILLIESLNEAIGWVGELEDEFNNYYDGHSLSFSGESPISYYESEEGLVSNAIDCCVIS